MPVFEVPQFIDIEDKIIGPLTLRQFLILGGMAAIIFIFNSIFALWLTIILGGTVAALGLSMAFLKVNGQYFSTVVFNGLKYFISPRLYVWRRTPKDKNIFIEQTTPTVVKKETKRLNLDEIQEMAKKLDK